MELSTAHRVAAELVAADETRVVRFAAALDGAAPVSGVVSARPGPGAEDPVHWLCAGKPVLAYATLCALASAGHDADTDLRPFLAATPDCPPITAREVFTYRSGLVRDRRPGNLEVVADPVLTRPPGWDPAVDAEYWNAGWEVVPGVVSALTGTDFEAYLLKDFLGGGLGLTAPSRHPGLIDVYRDPEAVRNPEIRRVFGPEDLATSLGGPLSDLCRFYQAVLADDGAPARELTSANPGPRWFAPGVSDTLRWAMGFPHGLCDQGFEHLVGPGPFGAQGAVLTLTPTGLRYAWVVVAGALPERRGCFAVAMEALRPVPDARYLRMAEALLADLTG